MTQDASEPKSLDQPPQTGIPAVDAMLAELGDLSQLSAKDQLEKLAGVQEALNAVLTGSADAIQQAIPGMASLASKQPNAS